MIDLAINFNIMQNNDYIMPINFTMGTCLVTFKVGSGGLKWIKAIFFMMRPTTSPTLFLSPLLIGI
jgi:hypothetical protein